MTPTDDDEIRAMLVRRAGRGRPAGLLDVAREVPGRTLQRRPRPRLILWVLRPVPAVAAVVPAFALVVLLAFVVASAPAGPSEPSASPRMGSSLPSSPPAPTTADARQATLDLEVRLSGGALYTEGFFSYLRLEGAAGSSEVELRQGGRLAGTPIPPGQYVIVSYQRPCEASCPPDGALDAPMDSCQGRLNVASGDRITIMVTVHPGVGCTIELERKPGEGANRPVVLCGVGVLGSDSFIRPGCYGAVHEAARLPYVALPPVETAVASLIACPATFDCPRPPPGALRPEPLAWRVRFTPADGGELLTVHVPAEQRDPTQVGSGGIDLTNTPDLSWPYKDLPCVEVGPDGDCAAYATPQPTPDASARALGHPLRIDHVEIPLTRARHVTVDLGEVVLPNGYHTRTTFRIANADDGTYRAGRIYIDLVPLDPGAPSFDEPMRRLIDGPERVRAVLTLDLESFLPGAAIDVVDLQVE